MPLTLKSERNPRTYPATRSRAKKMEFEKHRRKQDDAESREGNAVREEGKRRKERETSKGLAFRIRKVPTSPGSSMASPFWDRGEPKSRFYFGLFACLTSCLASAVYRPGNRHLPGLLSAVRHDARSSIYDRGWSRLSKSLMLGDKTPV